MNDNFIILKVQLKLATKRVEPRHFLLFQFHKGTIKANSDAGIARNHTIFQFHKGTIKADHPIAL